MLKFSHHIGYCVEKQFNFYGKFLMTPYYSSLQNYWFDVQIVNCIGNVAFSRLGNATRGPWHMPVLTTRSPQSNDAPAHQHMVRLVPSLQEINCNRIFFPSFLFYSGVFLTLLDIYIHPVFLLHTFKT